MKEIKGGRGCEIGEALKASEALGGDTASGKCKAAGRRIGNGWKEGARVWSLLYMES
jgi:hypothetical protein